MKNTSLSEILNRIRLQLGHALLGLESPLPHYRGKVRDVFFKGNEMVMVTTDRVSAFDVVLGAVPFKGSLLTEQAVFWLNQTRDVVDNHLIERLDDQIMRCQKAEPFKVEMVIRGYLAGSLLRESADTRGEKYGLKLDPCMGAYEAFEEPIVTATTKADIGHDMPISLKEIVESGLMSKAHLEQVMACAVELFKRGSIFSKEQGLLLVDTKYEFGLHDGKVILIDEIHTADSSRYWIDATYYERVSKNEAPQMLDKERLRSTLLSQGYDGENIATIPSLNDEMIVDLASHYWQLTEKLIGKPFIPSVKPADQRVNESLRHALA